MFQDVSGRRGEDSLKVYLAEYEFITDEVLKRIESKQKLLVYKILLIGIVITAGISIMQLNDHQDTQYIQNILNLNVTDVDESGEKVVSAKHDNEFILCMYYFLLITPLPFYYLSREYLKNILRIVKSAQYVGELRIEIKSLIDDGDSTQTNSPNILRYFYFDKTSGRMSCFLEKEFNDASIQFGGKPRFINKYLKNFPAFTSFPLILIGLFIVTLVTTFTMTFAHNNSYEYFKFENLLMYISILVLICINYIYFRSTMNLKNKIKFELKK